MGLTVSNSRLKEVDSPVKNLEGNQRANKTKGVNVNLGTYIPFSILGSWLETNVKINANQINQTLNQSLCVSMTETVMVAIEGHRYGKFSR